MQSLWNLFYFVAALMLWPRWTWGALSRGEYVAGLWRKLTGRPPVLPDNRPVIWMHAICVGEVLLLRPLIEDLRQNGFQVALSTFTSSGFEAARRAYPGITVFFVPFDFTWTVRRVYAALRPRMLVLSELELWPNLLLEARRRGAPVLVASTRIDDAELRFYRRISRMHRPALRCVTWWGAQTERDAARIAELLGPRHTTEIVVTGSLKFDSAVCKSDPTAADELKRLLNYAANDRVLVAGSTHDPEEAMLLDVIRRIRAEHPELKVILAPRNRHRFGAVASLLAQRGVSLLPRSRVTTRQTAAPDVLLLDSIGELPTVWQIADFAFVGGTWTTGVGGQNPIESAALGKPVCLGPHFSNFDETVHGLIAAGGAAQFETPEQFEELVRCWLQDPEAAQAMGRRAAEFVSSRRSAARLTIAAMRRWARIEPS